MITPLSLVYGILLPALVAGIAWGLGWRLWHRGAPPVAGGTWSGAAGCACACMLGFFGLMGWNGFRPRTAEGWLPWVACAAGILGLLQSRFPRALRLAGCLALAAVWVLTGPWKREGFWAWYTGMSLVLVAILFSTEMLAARRPGASIPLTLWIWTAGIAGALAATGSIQYGQLAGVLAAAMGAGLIASWLQPGILFSRGAVTVIVPLSISLLICGYFYSDLTLPAALILAFAPLMLWFGESAFVTRRKAWQGVMLRAGLIALSVVIALLIAAWPMLSPKAAKGSGPSSPPEEMY